MEAGDKDAADDLLPNRFATAYNDRRDYATHHEKEERHAALPKFAVAVSCGRDLVRGDIALAN